MKEFDFKIGAAVHCSDGRCGKLTKVIVDPETLKVTDLVVEKGFLLKHGRIFPVSTVEEATDEGIRLNIRSDDLQNYREYQEVEYEAPLAGGVGAGPMVATSYGPQPVSAAAVPYREKIRVGIDDNLEVLRRGTAVQNDSGRIGHLDHVLADADSGEITHLVVREGLLMTHTIAIPIDLVRYLSEDGISVDANKDQLSALPRYEPLAANGDEAEAEPDQPLSGQALTTRIETVLSQHPKTHQSVIEVVNDRGIITLMGRVQSVEARLAAGSVAAQQPGVTRVINLLEVDHV